MFEDVWLFVCLFIESLASVANISITSSPRVMITKLHHPLNGCMKVHTANNRKSSSSCAKANSLQRRALYRPTSMYEDCPIECISSGWLRPHPETLWSVYFYTRTMISDFGFYISCDVSQVYWLCLLRIITNATVFCMRKKSGTRVFFVADNLLPILLTFKLTDYEAWYLT